MSKAKALILVRGGGDLASGVILRLHRSGLKVIVSELAQPLAVRRSVSFAEAVYEGAHTIEGVTGRLVDPDRVPTTLEAGEIPVLVDPDADIITNIISSQTELPTGTSVLFSGSGNCILCHNSNGSAMTWNGIDVSPISYCRSTMMGNASQDPLWRAMVAEEVHNFPQHQQLIESTCLKCHSPMG